LRQFNATISATMEIITLSPADVQRLISEEVQKAIAITLPEAIRQEGVA